MADTKARTTRGERRGSARQRGYTARWERARRLYLAEHPTCVMCEREGRIAAATVVVDATATSPSPVATVQDVRKYRYFMQISLTSGNA